MVDESEAISFWLTRLGSNRVESLNSREAVIAFDSANKRTLNNVSYQVSKDFPSVSIHIHTDDYGRAYVGATDHTDSYEAAEALHEFSRIFGYTQPDL